MSNGEGQEAVSMALVEQAGTPTPAELQADQDRFLSLAKNLVRAIDAVDALLCYAIRKRCNPKDFVRHGAGDKETFYLQATGCRKIRGFFGVYMRERKIYVVPEANGHYTYEVSGVAGSEFFDRLMDTDTKGGTLIDVFGSRSSSDPFFSKHDREPDQNDVKKAAISNFEARAINGLIGTQNLTREDLKKFGINVEQVVGVDHQTGAEGGGNTMLISTQAAKTLYAKWKGTKVEDADARALLKAYGFYRTEQVTRDKFKEFADLFDAGPGAVKAKIASLAATPKPDARQPGPEFADEPLLSPERRAADE